MLPVGAKFNAPVLVIVTPVPTMLLVLTLPPVMLPLAEIVVPIRLAVDMLPAVTLPVADIKPVTYCPVSDTTTTFDMLLIDVDTLPLA